MIAQIISTIALFVLIFCILYLVRETYNLVMSIVTNGRREFIAEPLETGLVISYIITYCIVC